MRGRFDDWSRGANGVLGWAGLEKSEMDGGDETVGNAGAMRSANKV